MAIVIIHSQGKEAIRVGALAIDALVKENHEFKRVATQYPVEEGANITDHVRHEPTSLTIEGVITNHPTNYSSVVSQFFYDIAEGRERQITEKAFTNSPVTRVGGAWDVLMEMIGENETYDVAPKVMEPISVVTSMKLYQEMVITGLTITRDAPEEALRFSMSLQKIRRARKRTIYVYPADKTAPGVAGSADDKNNVSDQVSDEEKKKVTSTLIDIIEKVW
jgi:hypothetical protein